MRIYHERKYAIQMMPQAQEIMGGIAKVERYTSLYGEVSGWVIASYSFNGHFCGYY